LTNTGKKIFLLIIFINLFFFSYCKNQNEIKGNEEKNNAQTNIQNIANMEIKNSPKEDSLEKIFKFHYNSIVIDTHNDYLYQVFKRGANFGKKDNFTQSGLLRFKEGGVDLQFFAVWIPGSEEKRAYNFASEQINRLKDLEEGYKSDFQIANCYTDAIEIINSGKLCGMIGIEDGAAVMYDIENVRKLYDKGVRYIGLTWNKSNKIGTSAKEESEGRKNSGLTEFGISVVKEMDDIGMLIDVSHSGEKTFWDIMENTKNPIIASHSNCYALNPHYRNLKDEQIKAIADRGGVIMMNFLDDFINKDAKNYRSQKFNEKYKNELDDLYNQYGNDLITFNKKRYEFILEHPINEGTSIDDLIKHIDYIKNLVGIDYIGLGSDFDGGITPPNELYDATCYPILTAKLFEKGYTESDIKKILGENFLRVLKKVCLK